MSEFDTHFFVLHGPNLNQLGKRPEAIYGEFTYVELCGLIETVARKMKVGVTFFENNHEGNLIEETFNADAV